MDFPLGLNPQPESITKLMSFALEGLWVMCLKYPPTKLVDGKITPGCAPVLVLKLQGF